MKKSPSTWKSSGLYKKNRKWTHSTHQKKYPKDIHGPLLQVKSILRTSPYILALHGCSMLHPSAHLDPVELRLSTCKSMKSGNRLTLWTTSGDTKKVIKPAMMRKPKTGIYFFVSKNLKWPINMNPRVAGSMFVQWNQQRIWAISSIIMRLPNHINWPNQENIVIVHCARVWSQSGGIWSDCQATMLGPGFVDLVPVI